MLRPHIDFKQGSVVANWRTKDNNHILDYYLQKSATFEPFNGEVIGLTPIFKTPDSKSPRLKDYELVKCIGTGGFSRVYLVRRNDEADGEGLHLRT